MAGPDTDFWQARFDNNKTGWDRGAPSPQLLDWLESGVLQPGRIAVPGCAGEALRRSASTTPRRRSNGPGPCYLPKA